MITQWLLIVPFALFMGMATYLAVTPVNTKSADERVATSTVQKQKQRDPDAEAPAREHA